MKHYLFSFNNDITKNRSEILQNFELLDNKEVQKEIQNRLVEFNKTNPELSLFLFFGSMLLLLSQTSREELTEVLFNLKESFEKRPFDIHFSLILVTEYAYLFEHQNKNHINQLKTLEYEVHKNELLKEDVESVLVFKVEEPITQENRNFPLYFAYTLRQMPILKMNDFLTFHLQKYKGDYKSFLESLLIEYEEEDLFLSKTKKAIYKWLDKNKHSMALHSKVGKHKSEDERMGIVLDELDWLRHPTLQNEKVMFDKDIKQLIEYTKILVCDNKLPQSIKPIHGITTKGFSGAIRFTYHKIHERMQGRKPVNDNYIEFLHKVFPGNFTGKLTTTKTKFSVPANIITQEK